MVCGFQIFGRSIWIYVLIFFYLWNRFPHLLGHASNHCSSQDQVEARVGSQELSPDFPRHWHKPNQWKPHCCLPRSAETESWDQEWEAGIRPRPKMGSGSLNILQLQAKHTPVTQIHLLFSHEHLDAPSYIFQHCLRPNTPTSDFKKMYIHGIYTDFILTIYM